MKKKLIKIFKESFNLKIESEESFFKKNLKLSEIENYDSLSFLRFLSKIEKKFNIKIYQKDLSKIKTIKSTLGYLKILKKN